MRHHHRVDEQADHDRRRRQQDVVDESGGAAEPGLLPVLGQVDTGHHAYRCAQQRGQAGHHHGAEDRVGQAPGVGLRRRRHLGEDREVQPTQTEAEGLEQDPQQPEYAEGHRADRQHQRHRVDTLAVTVHGQPGLVLLCGERGGEGIHARVPSPLRNCDSSSLDSASTTKVMKNSTSPR